MARPLMPWGLAVVRGRSMLPTLRDGDRLLVRHGAAPRQDDLVVCRLRNRIVVKRATVRERGDGQGEWYVESDNRTEGASGWVPDADVLAVVRLRLWPLRRH